MKRAVLFIGLPGSGKSTYIKQNIFGSTYQIVDADLIKEKHPDYDPNDTEKVHKWSVNEAEKQMGTLSDDGFNICMDSGGVNNSYQLRIIRMLQSKGYEVHLIHMDTPLEVCLERNRNRIRKVPEHAIIEKSEKLQSCLEKQKLIVDKFTHVVYEPF
jgi:predicted kinase